MDSSTLRSRLFAAWCHYWKRVLPRQPISHYGQVLSTNLRGRRVRYSVIPTSAQTIPSSQTSSCNRPLDTLALPSQSALSSYIFGPFLSRFTHTPESHPFPVYLAGRWPRSEPTTVSCTCAKLPNGAIHDTPRASKLRPLTLWAQRKLMFSRVSVVRWGLAGVIPTERLEIILVTSRELFFRSSPRYRVSVMSDSYFHTDSING